MCSGLLLIKIIISTSFRDERNFLSVLDEHYRGREQRGVEIIELELVSHGSRTLFNPTLRRDWTIDSLLPSARKEVEKRLAFFRPPATKIFDRRRDSRLRG